MPELRNGTTVDDPRLDRLPAYDERSRNYQVRQLLEEQPRRTVARYPAHPTLDQGQEGACVGFSIATGMNASPNRARPELTAADARERLYWSAQRRDEWAGGAYPGASPFYEGTSILAGLLVARDLGLISSFYWCGAGSQRAVDDVADALLAGYGVLLGIPWYRSMFTVDGSGVVWVDPQTGLAGYHAIWLHSFRYAKLPGHGPAKQEHAVAQNTWGAHGWGVPWYGVGGHGHILLADLELDLLPRAVYGEAAVPIEYPA